MHNNFAGNNSVSHNGNVLILQSFYTITMTLIKSISGIRGTIGGSNGQNLTPIDIVCFTASFCLLLRGKTGKERLSLVIGRDARISGEMISKLVSGTLISMGCEVIDAGLSTTPTIEMAVVFSKADGGIIITASHNPKQWNALKLLNENGEFISEAEGRQLIEIAEKNEFTFSEATKLGKYSSADTFISQHIERIIAMPLVDVKAIKKAGFKVVIDCVNSTGGIALPALLKALGTEEIIELYCKPDGQFPHNPEPLPESLTELSLAVKKNNAHLGFAVDPDVDRLAIVCENGEMFGEEYTLVAVADFVLKKNKGNTVSNLSSSKALKEITEKNGGQYHASAVGEVNVCELMKQTKAVIGGEGNGGIIYPPLHYGRDALAGIALFLTHLARSGKSCSALRAEYPSYFISKNKIELPAEIDLDMIFEKIGSKYSKNPQITFDGLKIFFDTDWVHLRRSNTEAIIRIYSESDMQAKAENMAKKIIDDIRELVKDNG